jgi:hypothetical protein
MERKMHKIVRDGNLARGKENNFREGRRGGGGGEEEGEYFKGIKCNLWNGISWLISGALL